MVIDDMLTQSFYGINKSLLSILPNSKEKSLIHIGESGRAFAKRLLDEKYPEGGYPTGPCSEYNTIKKYGARAFK